MNPYQKLGLLGMLANSLGKTTFSEEDNPRFLQYLRLHGIGAITRENLSTQLNHIVGVVCRHFDYYDSSEMGVNKSLNDFLCELAERIENGDYTPPRDVSMIIISLGNKPGTANNQDGVENLIAMAKRILDPYEALDGDELPEQIDEIYQADSRRLEYLDRILSLVDVFTTARFGMLAGIEEYAPLDYNTVHPLETFDIGGFECASNEGCKCGCAADHSLTMLQGIEDYLAEKTTTPDYYYFEGVTRANGLEMDNISGSEGPVFDAVKNLGKVAYKAAMETWENVKALFDESEEDADDNVTNDADDNKKAIQSMGSADGAKINDNAKTGIIAMAKKIDVSGAMEKIVARLEGPSSAGGVIDGLLGLLGSNSALTKDIDSEKKAAEDALADLKKASESVSGDDSNKDAAAAAKAAVQDKISKAKDAVASVKKKAQDHNKVTKGIRKAIRGITPHIFISVGPKKDKEKDDDK
jgi:hypothetical protein